MKKKILLIEDEFFIRDLYERVLKKAGYEVIIAVNGEEGVTHAFTNPDIILLDIMLPKLNGIEVLRKIKSTPALASIPVVLITNLGQESVIKEAFDLGAAGYIMKMRRDPYEILKTIEQFLANPTYTMDYTSLLLD